MAQKDPLFTVLKLASEAEEQAALQLRTAEFECQKRDGQLVSLQDYRLDYMQQMESQQGQNISANYYHQFHRFVRQIDDAIEQQISACEEANTQRGYRQQYWMEKQQKRKTVELLLDKKAKKREQLELKREQKLIDEFASQQFFRRKDR